MTRARIVIALVLAAAIAILVWQIATQGDGPPAAPAPAAMPDASASPASADTRTDLPGATIVPKRVSEVTAKLPRRMRRFRRKSACSSSMTRERRRPRSSWARRGRTPPGLSAATTGDDGTVAFTLAPLEQLKGAAKEVPAGKSGVRVAIALPLDEPVVASFDREKVPESPIRLVLPATGRVIARLVTADGAPFTRDATTELQEHG